MPKTYVPNAIKINDSWTRHIINMLDVEECRIIDENKWLTFEDPEKLQCWVLVNDETRPLLIKAGALIPLRAI